MDPSHYAKLESHFARLLPLSLPLMSASEAAFAQEYVDVGEYGLALETIVDNLILDRRDAPKAVYGEIAALSRLMDDLIDDNQLEILRDLCCL